MESLLSFLDWEWRASWVLWLLWLPLIWWVVSTIVRRRQTTQYAESHLWPWVKVEEAVPLGRKNRKSNRPGRFLLARFLKLLKKPFQPNFLLGLAWMALVMALAGPRTSVPAPDESSRSGVDILFAMDLSRSMMVQDMPPNRFITARSLMESVANRLEPNDRLGFMGYAGRPHLISPLSFDRELFQHYLTLMRPGLLPTMGSQIKPALVFGVEHLQQTAGKSKILVVFTDGEPENFQRQEDPQGLKDLPNSGVKIILVGVGTGAAGRIPDSSHRSGYLHVNGLLVTSRLEEVRLRQLSTQLGATYLKASKDKVFLDALLTEVALQAEERSFAAAHSVWEDHAIPFIWVSLMALLMAFYPLRWSVKSAVPVLAIALSLTVLQPTEVWAESRVAKQKLAYQAYQSKDFDYSMQLYDELNDYQGWFGAGAAAYNYADLEAAVLYFRQAAYAGKTDWQRAQALFNLGNSYYQANLLPQAIEAYEQALIYQSDYEKAKHNLEVAKQRRQQEMRGQQQQDQDGEGQGEGTQSRDDSGAFYGGQTPNQEESGEGASGDSPEGEKQGKEFVLPDEEDRENFELNTAQGLQLNDTANAILQQQRRIQRIEAFEQEMQQVQDNQSELMIRLFERAEGFQARQDEAHPLPGVKPW